MKHLRVIASHLALTAGSILLMFVIIEGLVRVFIPQQLILIRPDIWAPKNVVGWQHAPNLDIKINTGEREIRLLTDANGHRIGSVNQTDSAYKILALGDSMIAALQVEYEQTLTALLEGMLSKELGDRVLVVNTAVGGWNPSHYLIKARQQLGLTKYNMMLVFIYLQNDIRSRRMHESPPRQSALRHKLRFPRNVSSEELINAIAYPINDFLETRSHSFILFKDRARFLLMRLGLSARYFADVLLRSEAGSPRWALTADICADIAREAATYDVPILFVLLAGVIQVDENLAGSNARALGIDPQLIDLGQPSRLLTSELEDRGLIVVDATDALKSAHRSGRGDLYGRIDHHFGPNGHGVVAEFIKPIVLEMFQR